MLDVLKPDLVIVRGLTLFKQLWLSSENGISAAPPPGLIQAPAYIRVPPPGWGNICLFDVIKRDYLSFKLITALFPLNE